MKNEKEQTPTTPTDTAELVTKQETAVAETSKEVSETIKEREIVQISPDVFLTQENMDALLAMSKNDSIKEVLSAEYLQGETMTEGEPVNFVFSGRKQIKVINQQTKLPEMLEAVKLYKGDGKQYLNASSLVVGDLRDVPVNSVIELIYLGKKKSNNGPNKYDNFRVSVLHRFKEQA